MIFQKNVKTISISKNLGKTSWEAPEPGKYYWRARFIKDGETSKASPVESFILKLPVVLPAPVIKMKEIEIEVIRNNQKNNPLNQIIEFFVNSALAETNKRELQLNWTKVDNAKAYKIQIANDKKFTSLVVDQVIKENSYLWTKVLLGDFYWRVQTINKNDIAGPASETGSIKIRAIPPVLKLDNFVTASIDSSDSHQEVSLKWSEIGGANFYKVTINGKESLTSLPLFKTKLENNAIYEWKVQALDSNKKPISRPSDKLILKLEKKIYQPPLLISPDNFLKINVENYNNDKLIIFQWQEGKADFYEIEFSRSPIFTRSRIERVDDGVVLEKKMSFFYKDKSKFQNNILSYYWRGRSALNNTYSAWSPTRSFSVFNRDIAAPTATLKLVKKPTKNSFSYELALGYGSYEIKQTTSQAGTTFNSLSGKSNSLIYGARLDWLPLSYRGTFGMHLELKMSSGEQQIDLTEGGQGTADLSIFYGNISAIFRKKFSRLFQINSYMGAAYRARYIILDNNNEFSTSQFEDFYLSIAPELVFKIHEFSKYSYTIGLDFQSKIEVLGDSVFYTLHLGVKRHFQSNWLSLNFYRESNSFEVVLDDASSGSNSAGQITNDSNQIVLKYGADFY